MLTRLQIIIRELMREGRSGHWIVIFLSIFITTIGLSSVESYINSIRIGLQQSSRVFLGGDIALSSTIKIDDEWKQRAKQYDLKSAEVWSYPTMVSLNGKLTLINLIAVSDTFPIHLSRSIQFEKNNIYLDKTLIDNQKSDSTAILGKHTFNVGGIIPSDIDALNIGWGFSPKGLIMLDDVPMTGTVVAGSRVEYRLLFSGSMDNVKRFTEHSYQFLKPQQKLITPLNQRVASREILIKVFELLSLSEFVILVLSCMCIYLSSWHYVRKHQNKIALYRCLGSNKSDIIAIYASKIIILSVAATLLGCFFGYIQHIVMMAMLQKYFSILMPAVSLTPFINAILITNLLVFLFITPSILQITAIPPTEVWRHTYEHKKRLSTGIVLLYGAIACVFIYMRFEDPLPWMHYLSIALLSIAFLYGLSLLIMRMVVLFSQHVRGFIRTGMLQIHYHNNIFSMQYITLTLLITLVLLLYLIKNQMTVDFNQIIVADKPNYFAINLSKRDVVTFDRLLKDNHIKTNDIYPMIRGRITHLNDIPIMQAVPVSARSHNTLHRDLNLSSMWNFPSDNKLTEGARWGLGDYGKAVISIEKKFSDDLGIKVGDRLSFQIGNDNISANVLNIRSLKWSSINPNFYVIFPPGLLSRYFATYITSFHLSGDNRLILDKINDLFPNVSLIDLSAVLQQLQVIINYVIDTLYILIMIVSIISILILVVNIQSIINEKMMMNKLLNMLGANKYYLVKSTLIEILTYCLIILSTSFILAFAGYHYLTYIFTSI